MNFGLEALHAQVTWSVVAFAVCVLGTGVISAIIDSVTALARPTRSRRRTRRRRPDTAFYVGRLEALRVVVCVVDRDGLRVLFESAPARWAQMSRPLARALAADALPGRPTRLGLWCVARRLCHMPSDGFVLERRAVRALAQRRPVIRGIQRRSADCAASAERASSPTSIQPFQR